MAAGGPKISANEMSNQTRARTINSLITSMLACVHLQTGREAEKTKHGGEGRYHQLWLLTNGERGTYHFKPEDKLYPKGTFYDAKTDEFCLPKRFRKKESLSDFLAGSVDKETFCTVQIHAMTSVKGDVGVMAITDHSTKQRT